MFGEGRLRVDDKEEGSASNGNRLLDFEGKDICRNAFLFASKNGALSDVESSGSPGNVFVTYKRRKKANITVEEDGNVHMPSTTPVNHQSTKEPCYKNLNRSSDMQARLVQKDLYACANDAKGCSPGHWRNVVLEQMSQTLEYEGGLQGCIRDAVKGSVHSCENGSKFTSQTCTALNKLQNGVCGNEGMVSNRPMQEPNCYTGKETCQRTFYEVISSEKFAQLCHLLLQSFPGVNSERVFDIGFIDSKMKEGAYENSPILFHADIQQVWTKIEKIGTDMVALAKSLSAISRISFCKQSGSASLGSTEVGKRDEADMHGKEDCMQACDVYEVCTCKNCGEKADATNSLVCDSCEEMYHVACTEPSLNEIPQRSWYCASCTVNGMGSSCEDCGVSDVYKVCSCKNCSEKADATNSLVCDSCEEMYHVACIEPSIEEIPERSWYCASCTANGMGSPHHDCVVCERMNTTPITSLNRERSCEESEKDGDMVNDLEESSHDLSVDELQLKGREDLPTCIICRSVFGSGEKLIICPHAFCPHKLYHVKCLTSNQLKTYAQQWYCPSCLCRSCLTDRDDDKIVMCDGCDHAYHIYCMQPPRTSVPEEKWFCKKCEADVRRIHQAKTLYEIRHHKLKKTDSEEGGEEEGILNSEMTEETVAEAMDTKPGQAS